MAPTRDTIDFEDLLEHADWVRGLAYRLVRDTALADDLVQEAWVKAIESPPRHASNLRAWLGSVVTRLAQSEWRSHQRRSHRERHGARPEALPPTDQLVHEAQLSSELVEAVTELEEPFKTVLLMRYFRDMMPARIARELDRPLDTVKTQLQRGLEQLRGTLDSRYGDRRSWGLALLPLARGGAPTSGMAALGSGTWLVAATVVALALWTATTWSPPRSSVEGLRELEVSELTPDSTTGDALSVGDPVDRVQPATRRSSRSSEVAPEQQRPRTSVAPPELYTLTGQVLDLDCEPQPGLELRWVDSGALRWLDDTHGTITGPNTWVPIEPDELARLRADDEALVTFAKLGFRRPELAIALLRDEDPPSIEAVTDGAGRFSMQIPGYSFELEILGSDLGILGRGRMLDDDGEELRTWFVGSRRDLHGTVVNHLGDPVADATVKLSGEFPQALTGKLAMGAGFSSSAPTTDTDSSGRFVFSRISLPRRSWISTSGVGQQGTTTFLELPEDSTEPVPELTLLLLPSRESAPQLTLIGRVLLDDGSPAPRATVVFAGASAETDARGEYALPLREAFGELCAARSGSGIVRRPDLGTELATLTGEVTLRDLVLPHRSLAIEGRVLDSSGSPVAGASIRLVGGTGLPHTSETLEDLAAGGRRAVQTTDAQGRFRVHGLADRDYRLDVRLDSRSMRSEPLRAGRSGVSLSLP